jgi:heme a synthase
MKSVDPPSDWRLRLPQSHRRWIRVWLSAIAATTFLVLVVGGVTRLTHSGLSMVDWKPLIGVVPPLGEAQWVESFARYQQYPEYRQLRPDMTLGEYKQIFFWEYLHRLAARLIGLVFLVPFAFFWFSGVLTRPLLRRLLALFALGAMQGILGWLMVRSGLVDRPSVSHYRLAAHLTLALVIFGLCVWLIRDLSLGRARATATTLARRRLERGLLAVGGLLALQVVWGAFVAGLKAGLLFNTFPLMGGALVPPNLWLLSPAALNFVGNPSAVQWLHRLLGTVLLVSAFAVFRCTRRPRMDRTSRRQSTALLSSVAAQYALGVLTLVYAVPIGLGVAHQAMAMLIVGLWVSALHHARHLAAAPTLSR